MMSSNFLNTLYIVNYAFNLAAILAVILNCLSIQSIFIYSTFVCFFINYLIFQHKFFNIYFILSTFIFSTFHDFFQLSTRTRITPTFIQLIYPTKRNATRRTNQLSGRSQVMDQFHFYRCKGMSVTAALHIF